MSRNRFVEPNTVRLPLSDGDWIEVKEQLTYGEEQALVGFGAATFRRLDAGGVDVGPRYRDWQIERMLTWIIEWSFHDDRDRVVPLSRDALAALDTQTAAEIDEALNQHITTVEAGKATSTHGRVSVATS